MFAWYALVVGALSPVGAFNLTSPMPGDVWDVTVPNSITWTLNSTDSSEVFISLYSTITFGYLPLGFITSDAGFYQVTPNASLPLGGYVLFVGDGFPDLNLPGIDIFNDTIGSTLEVDFSIVAAGQASSAGRPSSTALTSSTTTPAKPGSSTSQGTSDVSSATSHGISTSSTAPPSPVPVVNTSKGLSLAPKIGLGVAVGVAVFLVIVLAILLLRRRAHRRLDLQVGSSPPAYSERPEIQNKTALLPSGKETWVKGSDRT